MISKVRSEDAVESSLVAAASVLAGVASDAESSELLEPQPAISEATIAALRRVANNFFFIFCSSFFENNFYYVTPYTSLYTEFTP
jgi:hypothetical protein